jgi:hypothetical protein
MTIIQNISVQDISEVNKFLSKHGLNKIDNKSLLYKGMLGESHDQRVLGWKLVDEDATIQGVLFSMSTQ